MILRQFAIEIRNSSSYLVLHLLPVLVDGGHGADHAVLEALGRAVLVKGLEPEDLGAGLGVLRDLGPLGRGPEVGQLVIPVHHIDLELGGA